MSVTLVGIRAVGLLIARCGNEATRCSGGAAHRHGLGTCHSKGAAIVVEEDATTMTKFFLVRFIAKIRKVINCLFVCVGDEVEQSQELAVDVDDDDKWILERVYLHTTVVISQF
jgi:hypothetical protein